MREKIVELVALGPLIPETDESLEGEKLLKRQDELVRALAPMRPASDEEACSLVTVFGADDSFGLAWSVLHFIETAPNWPVEDCAQRTSSEFWRQKLVERYSDREALLEARTSRDPARRGER